MRLSIGHRLMGLRMSVWQLVGAGHGGKMIC